MKPIDLSRLHSLRMRNTEQGYDMAEMRSRFDKLKTRHEDGTAPQAVAAHQLFQTPHELAQRLASLLSQRDGMRILEPSAGLGRILDALKPLNPSEIVAVESHADLCRELYRQNREGVTLKQRDFLTVSPDELGAFDCVAMNPPFTMRSDIRHILHAVKFLRSGGTLAAICMAGPHREQQLRPLCDSWEPLPANSFAKEGTGVDTVLLTIKR